MLMPLTASSSLISISAEAVSWISLALLKISFVSSFTVLSDNVSLTKITALTPMVFMSLSWPVYVLLGILK